MGSIPVGSTKQKGAFGLFFVCSRRGSEPIRSSDAAGGARAPSGRSIPGGSTSSAQDHNVRRYVPRGLTKGLRLLFPHICCASVREPCFSRAYGLFFAPDAGASHPFVRRRRRRTSPFGAKYSRREHQSRRPARKVRGACFDFAPRPPSRRARRSQTNQSVFFRSCAE